MKESLSLSNRIRKIAVKLGMKQYLMPIYELVNSRQMSNRMKLYSPLNDLYGLNDENRDFCITVSFTTFPARIKSAMYVIDSMLRQTLKPDRILMVLVSSEIASRNELPEEYKCLERRGLSIVFTDENLKPHNKYQYAMLNFPNDIIITVDDDILYSDDLIETLFTSYKKYPHAVSAMRAHRMLFRNNTLLPYNDWGFESMYTKIPTFDLFATGVGGILYPPKCMAKKQELLFDTAAIRRTCLENDDIWLKLIQLLCDTPTVISSQTPPRILIVPSSQKSSLQSANVDDNRNDIILRDVMHFLGISEKGLFSKLSQS